MSDLPPPSEPAAAGDEVLLTRAEASDFLRGFGIRMKPATLARLWSTGGNGPPCVHVRRKPLYPRGVLKTWAQAQSTGLRISAKSQAQPGDDAR